MLNAKKSLILITGLILTVVGCAKRNSSNRDKLAANAAVGVARASDQTQEAQAQAQAAAQNVKTSWDSIQSPVADAQGNITVTSTFLYNTKAYQVSSVHQVVGSTVGQSQQMYDLGIDGITITVTAKCSDSQCSQYAVTYNFYKNKVEAVQQLLWVDFVGDNAPRIQTLGVGAFKDINTWYNFASDINNFLAP